MHSRLYALVHSKKSVYSRGDGCATRNMQSAVTSFSDSMKSIADAAAARVMCREARIASAHDGIPKHPQPSPEILRREAALKAAVSTHALSQRIPDKMAMFKPAPMNYTPDVSHLGTCTSCSNLKNARVAARTYQPVMASGSAHLFIDDAILDTWSGVVLELETPRKSRARFRQPQNLPSGRFSRNKPSAYSLYRHHPVPRSGFGMPGSVMHEGENVRFPSDATISSKPFRAWLGQSATSYTESTDGIHFDAPATHERRLFWRPQPMTPEQRGNPTSAYGEMGDELTQRRAVTQETFTVYRDAAAPPVERYKAAFTCDLLGHAPYPSYWEYKRGKVPPRAVWVSAPFFRGERHYTWESTCLGFSPDGLNWTMYDNGHTLGMGAPPLRLASDTANVIFRHISERDTHLAVNRWAAAIPPGSFGTPDPNPNWWREVRGVRVSRHRRLRATGAPHESPRAFAEVNRWIFDREGKDEHLRRQIYSLQVTPMAAEGVYLGLLNVLEWPKLVNPTDDPPFPCANACYALPLPPPPSFFAPFYIHSIRRAPTSILPALRLGVRSQVRHDEHLPRHFA